jgi:cathepsin F
VANFSVVSLDEDQIAANLVKNGPLAGKWTWVLLVEWLYLFWRPQL